MNAIKTIFKTYLGSLLIGGFYLWLIHEKFASNEISFIMLLMLIINLVLSVAYIIGILLPFSFLFKPAIAAVNFKEAFNKFLIYFSLFPLFLVTVCIGIGLQNMKEGIQFSLLFIDISTIVYLGLINLLKYKTIQ